MGKLPWTPWYFGDWLHDPALRSVSLAARGLWADMLAIMWESPERGISPYAAGKLEAKAWAKVVGHRADYVRKLVVELELSGVLSRRKGDRKIYSRRMVREELEREKARKRQQKHRASVTPNVTPVSQVSSSSSSSSSLESEKHTVSQDAAVEEESKNGQPAATPSRELILAFRALGHEPFGPQKFQGIWLESYSAAGESPNWTDIMENVIQRCKSLGVKIPGLFYKHKHEIENGEVKMRYKVTPL